MMQILLSALLVQDPSPPAASERLRPLAFMVGRWTGEGKLASGEAYSDEHRFEWMQGGHFLKAEYVLRSGGKVLSSATSIIGFDPERKRLVAFVFGSQGAIARSECVDDSKRDTWVFEGRATVAGGVVEDRVTQARVDDDTFRVSVEVKKDGVFAPARTYVYRRAK